jgi:predicted ribosome quality control (RQC) complex YloA/Tae2 family protein
MGKLFKGGFILPFDGILLKSIVHELNQKIQNGRVDRVFQPEKDEVVLSIRTMQSNYKLLLCANPSIPRIHLTAQKKENPLAPPNFCMVLRKHLQGAKIIRIDSFGYERILAIDFETTNELRDQKTKRIIVEIMGKHSNIMLINENNKIIDAIKHVDHETSRIREIMPARPYTLPPVQDKLEPDTMDMDSLFDSKEPDQSLDHFLVSKIMGFSPFIARNLCKLANIPHGTKISTLSPENLEAFILHLKNFQIRLTKGIYLPCLTFQKDSPKTPSEFYCFDLPVFENVKYFDSMSEACEEFYRQKDSMERLKQKKYFLRKSIHNAQERLLKKITIYQQNIEDVADRQQLKLYGDLILAFIHSIPTDADKVTLSNFYSENLEDIEIPLEPFLTPQKNASNYYKKYNKSKNTFINSKNLLHLCNEELEYLENVNYALENSKSNGEIEEIKQELLLEGLLKTKILPKNKSKKRERGTFFYQYKSTDGYTIFAGKNNLQNEQLTLKDSSSNDMWLHAKDVPGSHVIIKKQEGDIPVSTLQEAALIAAFHSKAKYSSNVPVDYTFVKHVKKPGKAKPGMVTYTNQKTLYVTPEEDRITKLFLTP